MRRSRLVPLTSIVLLWAGAAAAAELHFERFGPSRGLDTENVTAVRQDREGFLWIGSREGLSLYDGYAFRRFEHDGANPRSISDNAIRAIFEDRDRTLWIGTNTGGLDRLDRASWTFTAYRHDSADPASLSHDSVYAIVQDGDGRLWVGTQKGLNRFDPETGRSERFLPSAYVMTLLVDRRGDLWIGTWGDGIYVRDAKTGSIRSYRADASTPGSLREDRIYSIVEDGGGDLWVGTWRDLERMDRARGTFRQVRYPGDDGPAIDAIVVDAGGTVWAGTFGAGLIAIDAATGATIAYANSPGRDDSLSEDRIVSMDLGPHGMLWIGTWGGGLDLLRLGAQAFSTIGRGKLEEGRLQYPDVTAVAAGPGGRLWVGNFSTGLTWRDPGATAMRAPAFSARSGGYGVLSIAPTADGGCWYGSTTDLGRLDARGRRVQEFQYDPARPDGLGRGYVTAIAVARDGAVWVGTGGGGLERLKEGGRTFDRFVHDAADPGSLSDDYVTAIAEDRRGALWVGTRSGGLNAREPGGGRFTRYAPDPHDAGSLSHHYVTSIVEDSRGRLWVATGGGGLDRAERDATGRVRFSHVTDRDGLIDDNVMSIVEDDDGSLWLGTRRGLARYDPDRGRFAGYSVVDGLPSGEFNGGAAARGPHEIYLGTSKGIVVIPRGTAFPESRAFPTRVTSIRTLAGSVTGDRPAWDLERIRLDYGTVLFVDFAVLDFRGLGRHRYAYRLEDQNPDWVDLSSHREITFTDLEPGRHTLRIKGRSAEGVWSEAAPPLELDVVPPLWMTPWFRALLVLLTAGGVLAWHSVRTSRLERRNRALVALKEELQAAYDRLSGLTRRLEAAKEEERKRIARELHDEMGQALTAAKINIQLLSALPDPETRAKRIADTVDLVNRMIEHVRALSLDLRPPLLDELGLVPALRGYVEGVSQRSGLEIDVAADPLPAGTPAEIEIVVFRVVQEALTNVLRHAGARRVGVAIRVRPAGSGRVIDVEVRDDGRGFDVSEALERAGRGHHLGLLGILERARGLGGRADIASTSSRGTVIRVSVPLSD